MIPNHRFKQFMGMTLSNGDGEALTAIRMANRMLAADGLTWGELLSQFEVLREEVENAQVEISRLRLIERRLERTEAELARTKAELKRLLAKPIEKPTPKAAPKSIKASAKPSTATPRSHVICFNDGERVEVPYPDDASCERRRKWLAGVHGDCAVSNSGLFVAAVLAFVLDVEAGIDRMSSRDIMASCGSGAAISTDQVRAGVYSLRDAGHLSVERDGKCWRMRPFAKRGAQR